MVMLNLALYSVIGILCSVFVCDLNMMMMVMMVIKIILKMMMVMQMKSLITNNNHKDLRCQSPHPLQLDQPSTELARSPTGITCAVAELELLDVLLVASHVLKEPISNPSF